MMQKKNWVFFYWQKRFYKSLKRIIKIQRITGILAYATRKLTSKEGKKPTKRPQHITKTAHPPKQPNNLRPKQPKSERINLKQNLKEQTEWTKPKTKRTNQNCQTSDLKFHIKGGTFLEIIIFFQVLKDNKTPLRKFKVTISKIKRESI